MSTPVHRLLDRVETTPDDIYLRFLLDGTPDQEDELTYAALAADAARVAAVLQESTEPGDRVMLLFTPGLGFARALWGTLLAGRVAVPAYPPDPSRLKRTLDRLLSIVEDVEATTIVTSAELAVQGRALQKIAPVLAGLDWVVLEDLPAAAPDFVLPEPDDVALIQFTSGSTGRARGVVVSHGQLEAQGEMLVVTMLNNRAAIRQVGWAPFYHDMGLILGHFFQLHNRMVNTWMSPTDFLRDPKRWLVAAAHYRATVLVAPDFAFPLVARKCDDDFAAGLDLSSLVMLSSSAEPVRASSIRAFCARFDLDPSLFVPSYGLAENTLVATGGRHLRILRADRTALSRGRYIPAPEEAPDGVELVGSGFPALGRCAIVGLDDRVVVPDGRIGEVWLDQPSKASGYWKLPEMSKEVFEAFTADGSGPWLRTGDLGFMHDEDLYVTGRWKDLIVVRGANIAPHDIEDVLSGCHPSIRPGCVAAFAVETPFGEAVGVAIEVRSADVDLDAVLKASTRALHAAMSVRLGYLALINARTLPKTSSGKLRRGRTRDALLSGEITTLRVFDRRDHDDTPSVISSLVDQLVKHPIQAAQNEQTFAELGLDSVALFELRAQLEKQVGLQIGLEVLGAQNTVASVSEWLREPPEYYQPEVVHFSRGGSQTPLAMFPGGLGAIQHVGELAAALQDRTVFGLEPPWSGSSGAIDDVVELGTWYAQRVAATVPEGPIVLAGYSFGAFPAVEAARVLISQGREVPLVICLDGKAPRESWKRWLWMHVLRQATPRIKGLDPRSREIVLATERAWRTYTPTPYWGRTVLFRSDDHSDADLRAFSFLRNLETRRVKGRHRGFLRGRHVQPLVEDLEALLREC